MAHLLETVSKQRQQREVDPMAARKQETKAETQDACNMVFLAGEIQSQVWTRETGAFFLMDGGSDSKWIPCTVFGSKELLKQLEPYEKGDYIKLVGYIRVWGTKNKETQEWENKTEMRVTQIKSKPPENRHPRRDVVTDDDIPF